MAKATGKLVSAKEKLFSDDLAKGDTVTIELPKGMRAIGKCSSCLHARTIDLQFIYCERLDMTLTAPDKFGCWEWKRK